MCNIINKAYYHCQSFCLELNIQLAQLLLLQNEFLIFKAAFNRYIKK